MNSKIKLGYEIGTGKKIEIDPSHLLVTGLSQKAGKTTALESFVKSSGSKAIVFRTKVGEKSFLDGTVIPPYFKEKSDWRYIVSLIEATMKERVGRMDRAIIIKLAKMTNGKSLFEFKKVVDNRLLVKKQGFENMLLTNLQAYLEIVIPILQKITFSNTLELVNGLNIIDLERFSRDSAVQSLILASVLEEVLHNHKGVIVLIPEAWKFIPQQRGNPCKLIVEEFIRQGATNKNFIWIDSQDMTTVDKVPLKQISEWVLGYQSEKNEIKRTLDQIPLPKQSKPKEEEIMQLGTGIFIFASRDLTTKIYVQPFWLDDETAIKIAKGEIKVSQLDTPKQIAHNKTTIKSPPVFTKSNEEVTQMKKSFNKELIELREDIFKKFREIQDQITKAFADIAELQVSAPEIDEDVIISKVLQKIPITQSSSPIDTDSIIAQVLKKIPKSEGNITYEVSPLEKIKKDFIADAKTKILNDIDSLDTNEKKLLKYLESRVIGISVNELCIKCFLMKNGTGGYSAQVNTWGKSLIGIDVGEKQSNGKFRGLLKNKITELLLVHEPTNGEIDNLYNHILMEILK